MLLQADTSRDELLTDIEKIRTEVRRISHEMMPPALLDVNLDEALQGLFAKMAHAYPGTGISYASPHAGTMPSVPEHISYSIYRICQELTGNILRHAKPATIKIRLEGDKNNIELHISHDGTTGSKAKKGTGIGIASITQRLAAIGATASGIPFSREMTITCPLR